MLPQHVRCQPEIIPSLFNSSPGPLEQGKINTIKCASEEFQEPRRSFSTGVSTDDRLRTACHSSKWKLQNQVCSSHSLLFHPLPQTSPTLSYFHAFSNFSLIKRGKELERMSPNQEEALSSCASHHISLSAN